MLEALLGYGAIALAFLFPGFLITAIRTQDTGKSAKYLLYSCLSFGGIVAALILV